MQWHECLDFPYRKAGPLARYVLNRLGFVAITMPWAIYVLEKWHDDPRIVRHEYQHVAQMRRDGMLVWWTRAAWYLLRYGYRDSPYEVEARMAQNAD